MKKERQKERGIGKINLQKNEYRKGNKEEEKRKKENFIQSEEQKKISKQ